MTEAALGTKQLTDIFHDYSAEDIVEATRSTEAFANEVYDVTDSQGQRFFLKILKTQLPEVVATEVHMQQRLLASVNLNNNSAFGTDDLFSSTTSDN